MYLSEEDDFPQIEPRILGEALCFTSQTKLSPKWNRIAGQMVRGENFLSLQVIQSVHPDLRVTESKDRFQVLLSLRGDVQKWPKLTHLNNLDIDPKHKLMFEKEEISIISKQHLGNQWLHVLPNMTKGKVQSISR